jgi:hypothetical protein
MSAITNEKLSPIGPVVLPVFFDRRTDRWTCECKPEVFQLSRDRICDHVLATCKLVARTKGPWEQDAELMQQAWDAVRPRVQREEPNLDWEANKNFSTASNASSNDGLTLERYKELSKFLSRQIDTQALAEISKEMFASGGIFTGTDPASKKPSEYKTARVSYDETKGVQFTIDDEDVTDKVLEARITKNRTGDTIEVTLDSRRFNELPRIKGWIWDESRSDYESKNGKISGLKAYGLTVDELNIEHKEPEKPKKKKSRFTEIDL